MNKIKLPSIVWKDVESLYGFCKLKSIKTAFKLNIGYLFISKFVLRFFVKIKNI